MPKKPTPPTEPTQPIVERVKLANFRPATVNPNAGNVNSVPLIKQSIEMNGAGRPMFADKNGEMIGGSHSIQAFEDAGFDEVIVVKGDGKTPVIFQRTDVDINSPQGRSLQIGDNVIGVKSYAEDGILLAQLLTTIAKEDERFVAATGYDDDDVAALVVALQQASPDEWGDALGGLATGDRAPFQQMTFTLHDEQAEQVKRAIEIAKRMGSFEDSPNENSNGNALARICEIFITDHER